MRGPKPPLRIYLALGLRTPLPVFDEPVADEALPLTEPCILVSLPVFLVFMRYPFYI